MNKALTAHYADYAEIWESGSEDEDLGRKTLSQFIGKKRKRNSVALKPMTELEIRTDLKMTARTENAELRANRKRDSKARGKERV